MKRITLLIISVFFINLTVEARDVRDNSFNTKRIEGGYSHLSPKKKQGDDNWSTFGDSNPATRQPGVKIDRTYDPYKNLR